ncbi:MAG: LLM class flavin-dependent oxidoreductase [Deltaproteobacteria bacterium]|nr:LLM class flavin-dependent oxidoreductase [Deltaproteobacteria bacterium]
MANKRRYWGVIPPLPGAALGAAVRQCEAIGLEGVWAIQLWGPPFVTLGAAAMASTRLKLGSGVALAFVRSPLETAAAALDVDTISGGRMVLGIGPSVRWWNEEWFGVEYGKPIPHLREAVRVIRAIIEKGHSGSLGRIGGEYYKLNLDRYKALAAPVRTHIPIYLPALYETAMQLAGEVGDGLASHPISSEQWVFERIVPNVKKGLDKAGKPRSSFDLNVWLYVAPNADTKQAIAETRPTVAFYALHTQYEKYFAANGFGREARAIAAAAQAKDEAAMLRACTDAMVEKFAIIGSPDEVRRRIDRIAEVVDSFTLCAPYVGIGGERIGFYNQQIAETFYA